MKEKLSKILGMAKKQLAVIICGAIVVIGLVLAYWPTTGWYADLTAKVGKSASDGDNIQKLVTAVRHFPNTSADANATPAALPVYPTSTVLNQGKNAVKAFDDQSTQLLSLAVQLNEHFPLTPNALPNGSNVDRDKFARDFKDAVAGDSYIRRWPPVEIREHFKNLFEIPDLAAGQAPSADQIQATLNDVKNQVQNIYGVGGGGAGAQANADVTRMIAQRSSDALLDLYVDTAKKCKVYLQPGAIKPPNVLTNFNNAVAALPPDNIWSAQLWLWVVEDAATAVARVNANSDNVTNSPIKQILDLTVKEPPYLISGDPTAGNETTAVPNVLDVSPSGRVSNGMYDVLQFSMSLDVDADRVPEILDLLEQGQFLTVISVQYTARDSSERATKGFVYGNARIVTLDLICEKLYLKSWTSKYCPPTAAPAATPAQGGGGAQSPNMLTITMHGT
jgi:hypothetical protein